MHTPPPADPTSPDGFVQWAAALNAAYVAKRKVYRGLVPHKTREDAEAARHGPPGAEGEA